MEEEGEVEPQLSKLNSNQLILFRIDNLWKDCHSHSRNGHLLAWSKDLDKIYSELHADSTPEDVKQFWKYFDDMETCFVKQKGKLVIDKNALYTLMLRKELFLRKLQNKQGKGESYREGHENYMD